MTKRIGSVVFIEPTPAEKCSRCGTARECRDVLGNGSAICFGCATPREKEAYMRRLLDLEPSS